MKTFILFVFATVGALGAIWLTIHSFHERQCSQAGFDGYRNDLCIYQSRYNPTLEYVSVPEQAEHAMNQFRDDERTERLHKL